MALELDFDPGIAWIGGEPLELRWRGARGKRRWRPDFMVRTVSGTGHAVVVAPDKDDGPQWRENLEVLDEVAPASGWRIPVHHVPAKMRLENLELAGEYRKPVPVPAEEQEALEAAFCRERPMQRERWHVACRRGLLWIWRTGW
ncbi:hypothetical protein [Streptomyces lydicus]|uniref:hypothetical protein n=1 Tax=Streptomyces lydicus TaxID=47763 RepID=UPI0013DDCE2E|nr:hypothetical protein [Streptomyces lydicus]